ncbi:MAG TPA: O-methyltransferase [Dongiaceae bacterium]|nr:O-methyltransferase [Dongiaceae bacterium]
MPEDNLSPETWTAVDRYLTPLLAPNDPALAATIAANAAAGLPAIDVTATQAKLLQLFARMIHARKILEIGTLGGYSTIWMARALPEGGKLISLEYSARHAEVARQNIAHAGLSGKVEIRVGAALDSLRALAQESAGPFDLVFIDADKANNAGYFSWAMQLTRIGSVIVVDNVVRDGKVADANCTDPDIAGTRLMFEHIAQDKRVAATAIQTVGSKGYDGFALLLVTG